MDRNDPTDSTQQIKLLDAVDIALSIMYEHMYEFRDEPGKQLARLLSEHPINCKSLPMMKEDGDLTVDPKEKLEKFLKYYEALYQFNSGNSEEINSFLGTVDVRKLSQDHKIELDTPITLVEIKESIKSLKGNTSPRPDGPTVEFYLKIENTLSIYLNYFQHV